MGFKARRNMKKKIMYKPFLHWLLFLYHLIERKLTSEIGKYSLVNNPFNATNLFSYSLKTSGFLMFLGGVKSDQWHEIGYRGGGSGGGGKGGHGPPQ